MKKISSAVLVFLALSFSAFGNEHPLEIPTLRFNLSFSEDFPEDPKFRSEIERAWEAFGAHFPSDKVARVRVRAKPIQETGRFVASVFFPIIQDLDGYYTTALNAYVRGVGGDDLDYHLTLTISMDVDWIYEQDRPLYKQEGILNLLLGSWMHAGKMDLKSAILHEGVHAMGMAGEVNRRSTLIEQYYFESLLLDQLKGLKTYSHPIKNWQKDYFEIRGYSLYDSLIFGEAEYGGSVFKLMVYGLGKDYREPGFARLCASLLTDSSMEELIYLLEDGSFLCFWKEILEFGKAWEQDPYIQKPESLVRKLKVIDALEVPLVPSLFTSEWPRSIKNAKKYLLGEEVEWIGECPEASWEIPLSEYDSWIQMLQQWSDQVPETLSDKLEFKKFLDKEYKKNAYERHIVDQNDRPLWDSDGRRWSMDSGDRPYFKDKYGEWHLLARADNEFKDYAHIDKSIPSIMNRVGLYYDQYDKLECSIRAILQTLDVPMVEDPDCPH